MKLYYYSNISVPNTTGWFADMNKARAGFGSKAHKGDVIILVAHVGIKPPKGYRSFMR